MKVMPQLPGAARTTGWVSGGEPLADSVDVVVAGESAGPVDELSFESDVSAGVGSAAACQSSVDAAALASGWAQAERERVSAREVREAIASMLSAARVEVRGSSHPSAREAAPICASADGSPRALARKRRVFSDEAIRASPLEPFHVSGRGRSAPLGRQMICPKTHVLKAMTRAATKQARESE